MEKNRGNKLVRYLNELEFIDGYIYANVWMTTKIAVINMRGKVVRWIEAGHLHPVSENQDAVLNGVTFDSNSRKLILTGKLW